MRKLLTHCLIAEAEADDAEDAGRWQTTPAFFGDFWFLSGYLKKESSIFAGFDGLYFASSEMA